MAFTLANITGNPVTIYQSKIEENQAEEVVIPDSVKEILSNTFFKLQNLKKITFGKNVNVIENKFGFVKRNIKARIFCVLFCVFIWKETLGCVWIRRSLYGGMACAPSSIYYILHDRAQKYKKKVKK